MLDSRSLFHCWLSDFGKNRISTSDSKAILRTLCVSCYHLARCREAKRSENTPTIHFLVPRQRHSCQAEVATAATVKSHATGTELSGRKAVCGVAGAATMADMADMALNKVHDHFSGLSDFWGLPNKQSKIDSDSHFNIPAVRDFLPR